ncbi:MAG: S-layer homology domain-containing protein [Oscillospiraceae bacterium]|jgi:hypothetical protein|nr:S-layer homology domain-containing protein [Oscillospiraceae bacterium]
MKRFLVLILALSFLAPFAAPRAAAFGDIPDAETRQAAELLNNLGIIGGTGGDSYTPNGTFTRAMLAVLAVRLSGITDVSAYGGTVRFPDVRAGHWAHHWIMAAVDLKIITGSSSGSFEPGAPMRYSYLTTVLMRLLGYTDEDVGLNWPQSYIGKAEALGLSKGMRFSQNDVLTRGQVARLIYNFLYLKDKEGAIYIDKHFQTKQINDVILSFETVNGVSVITSGANSYTCGSVLDDGLNGKLASLLVDGQGKVLTVTPDPDASYRTVTVREKRANGLTLADGTNLPVPSLGVWELGGVMETFAESSFWENEPVTVITRDGTVLCVLRDSYENRIGAQFVKTILRLRTGTDGRTFVIAEDNAQYPVEGTIDPALTGRTGNLMINRDGYAVSFAVTTDHTYKSVTVDSVQNNGVTDTDGSFTAISAAMPVWSDAKDTFTLVWESIRPGDVLLFASDSFGRLAYIYRSLTRGAGAYSLAILTTQPTAGTLAGLVGENVADAVLYKNGVRAEPEMLDSFDVLMYYESAGILEASSIRVSGSYSSPSPNPQTPTSIKLLGQTFELLPEVTRKMASYPAGQRYGYLIAPDGRIADIRPVTDLPDTSLGLARKGTVTVGKDLLFTGTLVGFETLYEGKLCTFNGNTNGISVTPVIPNSGGALDLTAMTLGGAPIAPWCAFYDQVGAEGQGVPVSAEDIPATRVSAGNILYSKVSPSGYVTVIVMNNITGDAYKYGYLTIGSETASGEGGSTTYATVTLDDGLKAITDTLYAGSLERTGSRTIAGAASGYALNGDPSLLDLVTCNRYANITRFDFDGDRFVTLNGTRTAIADGIQVYIPATKEHMALGSARAYCKSFEVYTDPWGYKVRFIIGNL